MARRPLRLILGMTLLVTACQPETVMPMADSVAPLSTVGTTTTSPTTTTVVDGPVDICSRGMVWEAGTMYVADCFVHPMSFVPQEEGWGSAGGGGGHLLIRWIDPEDRDVSVQIALLSYQSQQTPSEVLASIVQVDGVVVVDGPVATELAGGIGVGAELEGESEQDLGPLYCNGGNAVLLSAGTYGHGFYEIQNGRVIGVGACDLVQAWVVDVGGSTVTILAGTEEPENHPIAVDAAERLFASMTFGSTP